MSITLGQTASYGLYTSTALQITPNSGSLLISVAWSNGDAPSVSDDRGNTWVKIFTAPPINPGDYMFTTMWYALNVSGALTTVTFLNGGKQIDGTTNASGDCDFFLTDEFRGVVTSNALNSSSVSKGSNLLHSGSFTFNTGSVIPTVNGQLVYAAGRCGNSNGSTTISTGTGFTGIYAGGGANGAEYQIQSTAAFINPTFSASTMNSGINSFAGITAAFLPQ